MRSRIYNTAILMCSLALILAFQNCKPAFDKVEKDLATSDPATSEPAILTDADPPVIESLSSADIGEGETSDITGVTFEFLASDSGSGVKTILCELTKDGVVQSVDICSHSKRYNSIANGDYAFRIMVTDQANNSAVSDPYYFSVLRIEWEVPTPSPSPTPTPTPAPGGSPTPTPTPTPTPVPGAINVGTNWYFVGDSQTLGPAARTAGDKLIRPTDALRELLATKGVAASSYTAAGGSGRNLAGHMGVYDDMTVAQRRAKTWVHIQESGGQSNETGQTSAAEFGATLFSFINLVVMDHSNDSHVPTDPVVISVETAFSFGEYRASQTGRNWGYCTTSMQSNGACNIQDTYDASLCQISNVSGVHPNKTATIDSRCRSYNLAQKAVIEYFQSQYAQYSYLRFLRFDVENRILAAEGVVTANQIWYQPYNATAYTTLRNTDSNYSLDYTYNSTKMTGINYHFTFAGNLVVALTMFKGLGYDVDTLTTTQLRGVFESNSTYKSFTVRDPSNSNQIKTDLLPTILNLF